MAATSAAPFPMTPGRRAALVFGVPVCLLLVAATGLSLVADFGEGTYPVSYTAPPATKSLTLNVAGRLTIKPAAGGQAMLVGTARYGLIRSKLSESVTASGAITLGYDCPAPFGDCELDTTLTVPATVTTLTADSGSGSATVTGTTGPVALSTGDGNVSVSHASGPLALNTASGGIQVSAITSATLAASSGNGDIRAAGVTSPTITANTDSGSIDGSGIATDTITASSGNGDITIRFTSVPRDVHVNTDSGNITLILPPGTTAYHVTAASDSGTVTDTLPQNQTSAHVITATSGNGNITISSLPRPEEPR